MLSLCFYKDILHVKLLLIYDGFHCIYQYRLLRIQSKFSFFLVCSINNLFDILVCADGCRPVSLSLIWMVFSFGCGLGSGMKEPEERATMLLA